MMAPVAVAPGDWVFASGYTLSYPGSRDALTDWIEALPADISFVFDPTPVIADIPRPILSRVLARTTWLSCNMTEAAEIAGQGDVETLAVRLLADHCPKAKGVVIRGGAKGCFVRLASGETQAIAGFKHSFDAARYANAAAALSVTRHGGSSAPTDSEIQTFLSQAATGAPGQNQKANQTA